MQFNFLLHFQTEIRIMFLFCYRRALDVFVDLTLARSAACLTLEKGLYLKECFKANLNLNYCILPSTKMKPGSYCITPPLHIAFCSLQNV